MVFFVKYLKYSYEEQIRYTKKEYNTGFIEQLYIKAMEEIIAILGKKEKYSVEEAARYFQIKYGAYRIPYEYAWSYEDASYEDVFKPFIVDAVGNGREEFDYSEKSGPKNITLVIGTVYNKELRKKYPDIKLLEERRKAKELEWANKLLAENQESVRRYDESIKDHIVQSHHKQGADIKRKIVNHELAI